MEERIVSLERANRRLAGGFLALLGVIVLQIALSAFSGPQAIECYSLTVRGGSLRVLSAEGRVLASIGPDGFGRGRLDLVDSKSLQTLTTLGAGASGAGSLDVYSVGPDGQRIVTVSGVRDTGFLEISDQEVSARVILASDPSSGPVIQVIGANGWTHSIPLVREAD